MISHHAFAEQAIGEADLGQQVYRVMLKHPGAHPPFHVLACLPLKDNRVDALTEQQVRQHEASRARPDDPDLRTQDSALP